MKLSILALVLCIGLLIWNAWLQIQVARFSHSGSSPTSLKLSSLEIVDADGNTVVEMQGAKDNSGITVQDSQGNKTVLLGSAILVSKKQANEVAILDGKSLQLATSTNDFSSISSVAVLNNNLGVGYLTLFGKPDQGISLAESPSEISSYDTKSGIFWAANSDMATKADLKNDALIDVNTKNFDTVRSDEGTFLISCQGVEPYLEGYKVHLQIGNPTMLTVNNPKLTVEWGTSEQESAKSDSDKGINDPIAWNSNWKKSLRQTTVTLNESLRPGFWNDVEVIVSPAKANELSHFKVSIETDSISLTQPPDQH